MSDFIDIFALFGRVFRPIGELRIDCCDTKLLFFLHNRSRKLIFVHIFRHFWAGEKRIPNPPSWVRELTNSLLQISLVQQTIYYPISFTFIFYLYCQTVSR